MDRLHQYFLSNVYRSPDDDGAPAPDPAGDAAPEPQAAFAGDAAPDPSPEPQPDPGATKPATASSSAPKWALDRIGEETNRRQAVEEAARAKDRRIEELTALLDRMQKDPKAAPTDPAPASRTAAPAQSSEVQQEAAKIVFGRELQGVIANGLRDFGSQGWNEMNAALTAYGINEIDFVASVMDIDLPNAHKIMHAIAQDGEKAIALKSMSPARRIAEIVKMTTQGAADVKPDAKPAAAAADTKAAPSPAVSRAPAPRPPIAPVQVAASVDPMTPEGNEKMTDAEFEAWVKKTGIDNIYFKRSA